MKKVKKLLISLVLFFIYEKKSYATTTGTYIVKESQGIEKTILICVGIGLIALVIFLGYKLDKKDEIEKRRDKFVKNNEKNKANNPYPNVSEEMSSDLKKYKYFDEEDKIDISDENTFSKVEEDDNVNINAETIENNEINQDITAGNYYSNDEKEDADEELEFETPVMIEDDFEVLKQYTPSYDNSTVIDEVDVNFSEETKEKEYDDNNEKINEEFKQDYSENTIKMNSTIVFDTQLTREENENIVRGYDYDEEDLELLDIQNTIKEANIKRYTRKKKRKVKRVLRFYRRKPEEPDELSKRYTEVIQNKIAARPKRGRPRKVIKEQLEEILEEKPRRGRPRKIVEEVEEEKPKRGRPRKTTKVIEEKPKRGRPRKVAEEEKPKRGRPRKVVEEEKPKRGRPRK